MFDQEDDNLDIVLYNATSLMIKYNTLSMLH